MADDGNAVTHSNGRPLVYTIGLEPLIARALYADLTPAVIRRRRPLRPGGRGRPAGRSPHLVLLDLNVTSVLAELAAAWAAWGEDVVIVGVGRRQPYARVWRGPDCADLVEIGPGFLAPYLAGTPELAAAAG